MSFPGSRVDAGLITCAKCYRHIIKKVWAERHALLSYFFIMYQVTSGMTEMREPYKVVNQGRFGTL